METEVKLKEQELREIIANYLRSLGYKLDAKQIQFKTESFSDSREQTSYTRYYVKAKVEINKEGAI